MKYITKSRTSAVKLAKQLLRAEHNVKYLKNCLVVNKSTQCNCGQTSGVVLDAKCNGSYEYIIVGYCKTCGE